MSYACYGVKFVSLLVRLGGYSSSSSYEENSPVVLNMDHLERADHEKSRDELLKPFGQIPLYLDWGF